MSDKRVGVGEYYMSVCSLLKPKEMCAIGENGGGDVTSSMSLGLSSSVR